MSCFARGKSVSTGKWPSTSEYRDLVKTLAQMYVYRDGFGVRMGNDWLRLGAAWTSASGYYSLKLSNVVGFFRLSVGDNPELIEKSDRDGRAARKMLYQSPPASASVLRKSWRSTSSTKMASRLSPRSRT